MILKSLLLTNFKNIASATLDFSPKINCFLGNNGMGKSNLLDAIYFLSFTKSFARLPEAMLIRRGEDFAIINGRYLRNGTDEEINVGLRTGARKSFRRGGKEYKRISSHIGLFPAVMVAPADQNLVTGAAEERRRFIDMIISQADMPYMEALMRYNQALEQRNRMLRDGFSDPMLYESVEMIMDGAAALIRRRRSENTALITEIFTKYYSEIAGDGETAAMQYMISGDKYGPLALAFAQTRERDTILKYTSVGPHRDDIAFTLDSMPVRQTASQGQSKTFTIALRLAQFEFLRRFTGRTPLLLLDDIFDKLDAARVERIMNIVGREDFGQIFITDTNRKHLDEIMALSGPDYRLWTVDQGSFTQIGNAPRQWPWEIYSKP